MNVSDDETFFSNRMHVPFIYGGLLIFRTMEIFPFFSLHSKRLTMLCYLSLALFPFANQFHVVQRIKPLFSSLVCIFHLHMIQLWCPHRYHSHLFVSINGLNYHYRQIKVEEYPLHFPSIYLKWRFYDAHNFEKCIRFAKTQTISIHLDTFHSNESYKTRIIRYICYNDTNCIIQSYFIFSLQACNLI